MTLFGRLFAGPRDGASPGLEAIATGISPALLDAAELEINDQAAKGVAALEAANAHQPAAPPQAGRTVVDETIMAKVLHGWLQNRHQTLFPLAMNVRTLDPAQRITLAQVAAVTLLAERGHAPDDASRGRERRVREWLAASGAEADTIHALDAAMADPPATSRVLDAVLAHDLAPHAYVAAILSLDGREGAGAHLLQYMAARLSLPATLVRSAQRRYGA